MSYSSPIMSLPFCPLSTLHILFVTVNRERNH